MPVESKNIPGFLPEKDRKNANYIGDCLYGKNHSWETIDYIEGILEIIHEKQGEVSLRFNREKLAKLLFTIDRMPNAKWEDISELTREYYREDADAIESNIQDIIEVCPADKERK